METQTKPLIGKQLGSYEIVALLGRGGMGEIYRARDQKLRREVALKVLPTEFAADAERMGGGSSAGSLGTSLLHPEFAVGTSSAYVQISHGKQDNICYLRAEGILKAADLQHRGCATVPAAWLIAPSSSPPG